MSRALVIVTLWILGAASVLAGTVPLPTGPTTPPISPDVGGVVGKYLNLALSLGALIAFGAIVWGGFKYIIAAGNASSQSDARDQIWQAVIGLLLLVGSGLILRTIDERLVTAQISGGTSTLQAASSTSACSPPCKDGQCIPAGPNKGTCGTCSLDGGDKQVCVFNPTTGTPELKPCPPATLKTCQSSGDKCKAVGQTFVCAPARCNDGGRDGPCCPPGKKCDCVCLPISGSSRPYQCVKKGTAEACSTKSTK